MTILYKFLTRDEDIELTIKADKIFKHYGREHQFIKLSEELSEFNAAFMRLSNNPTNEAVKAQMMEEMADMTLVLQQIIDYLPADLGRAFAAIVTAKADRQLKRIEEEKHD